VGGRPQLWIGYWAEQAIFPLKFSEGIMAAAIVCACCGNSLETRDLYVAHTKTAWHKENSKRKMFGRKILTEDEWQREFGDKEKKKEEDKAKEVEKKEIEKREAERKEAEREKAEKERQEVEKKEAAEKERQEKEEAAALAADEAMVCVIFDYKAERWNHKFTIKKGCTILDLKRLMVKPDAPEEEAVSFDLQKRRVRINNFDTIDSTDTFEFNYIGPEEGMKKKVKDKETKEIKEEQARQFRLREEQRKAEAEKIAAATGQPSPEAKKKQEQERLAAAKAEAERKKAEKEAELAKPFVEDTSGPLVDVVVKHLEKGRYLTVSVPSTCSIGFVKQAIWDVIGRTTEFDLGKKAPAPDVSKLIPGLDPFDPREKLGSQRELFTKGAIELIASAKVAAAKAAAAKAASPGGVGTVAKKGETLYHIVHDTDGDKISVSMPKKKTIADLKRAICTQVCRGTYSSVVLASSSGSIHADKQELDKLSAEEGESIRLAGIQICAPYPVQLRVVHAEDDKKPYARSITVTVDDTAKMEEIRKAVSVQLKGKMMDIKIVGKMAGTTAVSSVSDSLRLNGKKEVLGTGKLMDRCSPGPRVEEPAAESKASPAAPAAPVAEVSAASAKVEEKPAAEAKPAAKDVSSGPSVDLRIQLDPDDEFMEQDVTAPAGADIRWVKEKLCSLDPTGSTKMDSFDLAYYGGNDMFPLPDTTSISASARRLVILQK